MASTPSTPTSIQERLQLKRVPLDDWSIREKLGLATAVLCSGDQNWMSVSRALKIFGDTTRPADWFSQKSCAAQYGKLLENVETPKRKKRTLSERDSSTPVETPGELIVRKLTQERIAELQRIMLEEQQEFQKLRDEIVVLQSPHVSEEQIREMVAQIEEEKRQHEIEKADHAEFLRKREQRKIEIERAWRPGLIFKNAALLKQQQQQVKSGNDESVDTDDTCSTRSSTGQSPLLTSLLKSPSSTPNLTLLQHNPAQSSPNANISTSENYISIQSSPQLSASQAAPTLSMLLDSGKTVENITNKDSTNIETQLLHHQDSLPDDQSIDIFPEQIPSVESTDNVNDPKDDEQLMEVFKGLIPDNIDELADILTENNALLNPELLEGEEMLDEVINQEEAQQEQQQLDQQDISKMDTFDQLKHETMLEERSKREAAALKALNEESSSASVLNISPEDSNLEDDLPLRVLQKDIQQANKAKQAQETTFQEQECSQLDETIGLNETCNAEVINLDENSLPEPLSTEQPYAENSEIDESLNKTAHNNLNPNGTENVEDTNESSIRTETDEKMDLEFEDKPLPGTIPIIKTEIEDSSVDEPIITNIKRTDEKALSDEEEIFEDAKETITPEKVQKPPIADTDEESGTDIIVKDESKTRARRDYTRKRPEPDTSTRFEKSFKQESDRSDSPMVLDDDSDNAHRTRRRYSSTPVSDSVPGSPASVLDDKELKAWRKLILLAYGRISSHKNASVFGYLSTKDTLDKKSKDLILRPMDMATIKKNIEIGGIKTTTEFQRDIMLMCTNIMLVTPQNSSINQQAKEMMTESISIIKITMDGCKDKEIFDKNTNLGSSCTTNKRGSRKSLRGT